MVGRGSAVALAVALALGVGATQARAQDEAQRLVMVYNSPEQIQTLEKQGYDVGYIGDPNEAAVYLTSQQENLLRAQGFTLGQVVADDADWQARKVEMAKTDEAEALAAEVARNGITKATKAKGAVNVPGHVVIQRAYTFTNYAGRFLYVEARNDLHTDTTGPAMSFTYTSPNGTSAAINLSNSSISPDGNDAAIGGNKLSDSDAGAGFRYMYHRGLIALQGANASLTAAQITVRVADANGNFDDSGVTEWANKTLPARVAAYQKDFITKYMDPTEINTRLDQLMAANPGIMTSIDLPNKTGGYQRQGMAMMAGTTAANGTPATAAIPGAVYLQSKAMGQNGGNDITAEFKNPAANSSPLSVAVTNGTWRTYDQADTDSSNGITETSVATKDLVVNLATDATGAVTSTAAQVVAAINADPAASALVAASLYAGNAGAGVVTPTPSRAYQVVDGTTGGPSFNSTKVRLSDYLKGGTAYWTGSFTATPPTLQRFDARHITKGPFTMKVYRITAAANRSANKTGIFVYCEQHAREWVGGITCLETAQRLVTNYATDPTTKAYVDNLDIFILPVVNPDGTHYAFQDGSVQRKNMTNYCPATSTGYFVANRGSWGVDLNRNNEIGSLFDGYSGASTSCTTETFSGPSEVSEPEIKNEHWVVDNFPGIKFAMNLHTHGGYFMWAPGAYISAGRKTLPAPNIGIEKYFFQVSDDVLSQIKSSRNTVILPQRTGPIADVLYSAAGNSADDMYYRKGIIGYSFEAGAQRIAVNATTGAITRTQVGFQPCFAGPGTQGGQGSACASGTPPVPNPLLVNEGHDEAMEFAEGNLGLINGALQYSQDVTPPQTIIQYSSNKTSGDPINYKFDWVGEGSIIFYTTDGTTPVIVPDDPATPLVDERCTNTTTTKCYNGQGPRMPGQVLTLSTPGAYTIKWTSQDMKGNIEPVQTQRLLVAAVDQPSTPGGTVPATLSLTLGTPASFAPFTPGVAKDYTAGTTANVISTAGDATLSISDPSSTNTGKLVNGAFALPQVLQASASSLGGTGRALAPIGGSAAPTTLLTYSGPVSNDAVALSFKQSIGANDALRTGTYSKTFTFTLSTTNP